MRTITIIVKDSGGFDVFEGERYCDHLCWDEMLGTIVELTHPSIGKSHYPMLLPEEHMAWRESLTNRANKSKLAAQAARPLEE